MRRLLLLLFPALFLVVAFSFTSAPVSATDTYHCANLGTLKKSIPIADGKIGYLKIYYNSSNGYNCAKTVSSAYTDNVEKPMYVEIHACKESVPGKVCTWSDTDYDKGSYSHYAGPAGVYALNRCIVAEGYIQWEGKQYNATFPMGLCG